jgi:hypothetical protein
MLAGAVFAVTLAGCSAQREILNDTAPRELIGGIHMPSCLFICTATVDVTSTEAGNNGNIQGGNVTETISPSLSGSLAPSVP